MQDREVMQLALDALAHYANDETPDGWHAITAIEALCAALSRPKPEQEPVAWMCPDDPELETAFSWQSGHCVDCGKQRVPVYTAPSQHEWQGLTVEEAVAIYKTIPAEGSDLEFAKAIEAKLKEKNAF